MMSRGLRWVLLLAVLMMLAACSPASHEFSGAELAETEPVPDFTLTAAGDTPVSLSDYRGQWVYLYFGYTFCPDACPITLAKLAQVQGDLGDEAGQMQVLMVSVDPERDTPDLLADYVSRFDPRFVGMTGSPEVINAAGAPFGLFYQQVAGSSAENYLIDHTTRTYLIDPDGVARVAYRDDVPAEAVLADLQWLIDNDSQ